MISGATIERSEGQCPVDCENDHDESNKGKSLLQRVRQGGRTSELDLFNVIRDARDQPAGGMRMKKTRGLIENLLVEIVAQVHHDSLAQTIQEVGRRILCQSLEQGNAHKQQSQRDCDIGRGKGIYLVQVQPSFGGKRPLQQLDARRRRGG